MIGHAEHGHQGTLLPGSDSASHFHRDADGVQIADPRFRSNGFGVRVGNFRLLTGGVRCQEHIDETGN